MGLGSTVSTLTATNQTHFCTHFFIAEMSEKLTDSELGTLSEKKQTRGEKRETPEEVQTQVEEGHGNPHFQSVNQ